MKCRFQTTQSEEDPGTQATYQPPKTDAGGLANNISIGGVVARRDLELVALRDERRHRVG